MSYEERQPSLAGDLARHGAQQVLLKAGTALGAKGAIAVAVGGLVILMIALLVATIGAAFQTTTAVWPVTVATDAAGGYAAAGWAISSRYGWRDNPQTGAAEFHDGIDLASQDGACPFGEHCGAPAMFDGTVQYVGWDLPADTDPSQAGGGELVVVSNGQNDHQTLYAHLEPYRLYVQLQGRIEDNYGRYDSYRDYQPIGQGPLQPDLANGSIEMTCLNDMPNFVPARDGPGTVVFLYDRPADCTTMVVWGERGGGWRGWVADEPGTPSDDPHRAELRWRTPLQTGLQAGDVALRFRAHLIPPPPPPITPTATLTPAPVSREAEATPILVANNAATRRRASSCITLAGGLTRCSWALANLPVSQEQTTPTTTPTPLANHALEAALVPPAIRPGETAELRIAVHAPAHRGTLIIALPNGGALRLAPTIPSGCSGSAELLSCLVSAPVDLAIPLELREPGEGSSLNLSVMFVPDDGEAVSSVALQLQVVQDLPTPMPATPTPDVPNVTLTPEATATPISTQPDCAPLPLVRLPNVAAPDARLVAPAAASFAAIRQEIQQRTGLDALGVLADALRQPSFTTDKPGVLATSWHKAGRAIDLNQAGPFRRVAEGRMFRLFIRQIDITAIFEAHGWRRIPAQGDTSEWWHYEWHPEGVSWAGAMRQLWDLATLTAAFPKVDWASVGCMGEPPAGGVQAGIACVLESPRYASPVETLPGCGPPVRAGDQVAQLDSVLGFIGMTGRTTGPHLHLGLKVRSYDGSWPIVDICTPEWLEGRAVPPDANCFTDRADPLAFLPRAPASAAGQSSAPGPTAGIIPEGAPYQLPPPNYPGSLVFTPLPEATPVGQYWSPYAEGGRYGGGGMAEWLCSNVWSGFSWCG